MVALGFTPEALGALKLALPIGKGQLRYTPEIRSIFRAGVGVTQAMSIFRMKYHLTKCAHLFRLGLVDGLFPILGLVDWGEGSVRAANLVGKASYTVRKVVKVLLSSLPLLEEFIQ